MTLKYSGRAARARKLRPRLRPVRTVRAAREAAFRLRRRTPPLPRGHPPTAPAPPHRHPRRGVLPLRLRAAAPLRAGRRGRAWRARCRARASTRSAGVLRGAAAGGGAPRGGRGPVGAAQGPSICGASSGRSGCSWRGGSPAAPRCASPTERVVAALRDPGAVEVLVQPELRPPDPARFAPALRAGLRSACELGPAVPDLVRIRRLRDGRPPLPGGRHQGERRGAHLRTSRRWRSTPSCWRRSAARRASRAGAWTGAGAASGRATGAGRGASRSAAYRHHVEEMLRRDLPRVARQAPEAVRLARRAPLRRLRLPGTLPRRGRRARRPGARGGDHARRPSEVLHERGIRTVRDLAGSFREGHLPRVPRPGVAGGAAAAAGAGGAVRQGLRRGVADSPDAGAREDVRVVLTAEGDPVTGRCFALGMRVEASVPLEGAPPLGGLDRGGGHRRRRSGRCSTRCSPARGAAAGGGGRRGSRRAAGRPRALAPPLRGRPRRVRAPPPAAPAPPRRRGRPAGRSRGSCASSRRAPSPPQPDVLRSSPGTVLAEVVSALFALPVPYAYDLAAVSDRLRPSRGAWAFAPPRRGTPGPSRSQLAFERIHNVWRDRPFGEGDGAQPPEAVREEIRATVASKLEGDRLGGAGRPRARGPARAAAAAQGAALAPGPRPPRLPDPMLETLRRLHRAGVRRRRRSPRARSTCCRPPSARGASSASAGSRSWSGATTGRWSSSSTPACRDAKFRVGRLQPRPHQRRRPLAAGDRPPPLEAPRADGGAGGATTSRRSRPRVVLSPSGAASGRRRRRAGSTSTAICVLDRAPADFNTARLLATLRALAEGRGRGGDGAARSCAARRPRRGRRRSATPDGAARRRCSAAPPRACGRPVLNADQERAWRAALERPRLARLGPARHGEDLPPRLDPPRAWPPRRAREGRPLRVLVAAATHRAIVNVLAKLARRAARLAGSAVPLRGRQAARQRERGRRGAGGHRRWRSSPTPGCAALLREAGETGARRWWWAPPSGRSGSRCARRRATGARRRRGEPRCSPGSTWW